MPRLPVFGIRLDPEVKARWKASASQEGRDLANYISQAVEMYDGSHELMDAFVELELAASAAAPSPALRKALARAKTARESFTRFLVDRES